MSALTQDGELNRGFIERELVAALAEDHAYRVTDEAKKKHIATAASYDEFRNFVACADQKRVRCADTYAVDREHANSICRGSQNDSILVLRRNVRHQY
jgi:hypothetical protein